MALDRSTEPAPELDSPTPELDSPTAGGSMREAVSTALGLFVGLRLGLGLLALWLWFAGSVPTPCHFELARNGWQTIPPLADGDVAFPLVGVWQRWDACWYTKIATFGYEAGENSANFWPLFPLLTGVVGRMLFGAMALGGLIVSGLAYVAAMVGLWRLVERDFSAVLAERTVIAISLFPTAFFFFAPFTEALFLALSVWAILLARERSWWAAAVLAGLAALTRIQGVFLVLPLAWEAAAALGALAWRPGRPVRLELGGWVAGAVVAVAAPIAGFLAFNAFASVATGVTPFDTQDAWGGRSFHPPWDVVAASWQWALDHSDPLQLLNLVTLVGFGVAVVVGLFRLPAAYSLFAIPQVLLLATRIQPTPLTSTARYLLVIFPVFVLLAMIPNRHVRRGWLIVSGILLTVLAEAFLLGEFVA